MNVLRTKRAAAFGMAGALALGTVVSAGVMSPADAVDSNYTCTLSAPLNDQTMSVSGTLTLPASVQSGSDLAGMASTLGVTLPAAIVSALTSSITGLQSVGGSASGVAFPVTGASAIPLNTVTIPQSTPAGDGTLPLMGSTTTKSVRAPLPGDYPVTMPKNFSFDAIGGFGGGITSTLATVPCTTSSPAAVGTLHVVKATSKTTAKLAAPSKTSRATQVIAKVRAAGYAAKGKVLAKLGTRTVDSATLKSGKATLNLGKLKAGKHTVKVIYRATSANKASSTKLSFTTKRG